MFLPRALSAFSDAQTAVERLQGLFEAELSDGSHDVDPNLDVAIRVKDASFQWTTIPEAEQLVEKGPKGKGKDKKKKEEKKPKPKDNGDKPGEEPFAIDQLNMEVPRGRLVAIVGPVGSGKSSILQGVSFHYG